MLKDIKIKIESNSQIKDVLDHAVCIGYTYDHLTVKSLLIAPCLVLGAETGIRWCTDEKFNTLDSYIEYTVDEFYGYLGYDVCSCGNPLPEINTDWECPRCKRWWKY